MIFFYSWFRVSSMLFYFFEKVFAKFDDTKNFSEEKYKLVTVTKEVLAMIFVIETSSITRNY